MRRKVKTVKRKNAKKKATKSKSDRILKAVFTHKVSMKPIVMKPKKITKNEIIYVRLMEDDVKQLDYFKRKLKVNTRSEMVRDFLLKAMNSVTVKKNKTTMKYC